MTTYQITLRATARTQTVVGDYKRLLDDGQVPRLHYP